MTKTRIAWICGFGLVGLSTFACSSGTSSSGGDARGRTAETSAALGTCDHDICTAGGALVPMCDPCATKLCLLDAYCCATAWDATCVGEAQSVCGTTCTPPPPPPPADGGTDGPVNACAHAICAAGGPLANDCDPCATSLCAQDPYCCATAWDTTCVGEATSICGTTCN